jgi:hypothetical protein
MHNLDHPVFCQSRKHRQLVSQELGFAVCLPLDIPMVYSPKLTFITNHKNTTSIGLALGETIYFGSMEFTIDRFSRLSISPKGMTQALYS